MLSSGKLRILGASDPDPYPTAEKIDTEKKQRKDAGGVRVGAPPKKSGRRPPR